MKQRYATYYLHALLHVDPFISLSRAFELLIHTTVEHKMITSTIEIAAPPAKVREIVRTRIM